MKKSAKRRKTATANTRISHTRKPERMTDFEWQTALRRQIAADERYEITKVEDYGVYGDYTVKGSNSHGTYKVALRSADSSLNFCSCPDFKTNQLGTCKHIEAVLLKIKSSRKLKKELSHPYVPPYSSVYLDYRGVRKVRLRIGTEQTAEYEKLGRQYFDSDYILKDASIMQFEKFLEKAHSLHPEFRCYGDALEFVIVKRNQQQRRRTVTENYKALLSGISRKTLFPYQQQGALFAVRAGRCILADDMGLGKTLQSIVATEVMRKHFGVGTALIVCPTSLKYQWKTEIAKFIGNTNVCVVEGGVLSRKKIYNQNTFDYIIISYQVAANDVVYLNEMGADVLILDEAQRIKNWKAKTSSAVKRIKTTYAMVLTGTPVENRIEDLYSLMQVVNPFTLGSLHHFLSKHQVKDATTDKVVGYKNLNDIGSLLHDVLLRRTKKEVLKELPKRMDKNLFVPLTQEQADTHKELRERVAKLIYKWRRMHFLSEEDRQKLLKYLNMMRMVCDSTYIIDQETNFQTKIDEMQSILEEILAMSDEKVVIFSQWERMTRLVANCLQQNEIGFEYLHGGVPSKKRGELYKNFAEDPNCRVFLSTDAGGVGLNLQSAAYVINLDIPWNPAVLEQRIGRVYRLGQKKNVSVINLVSQNTIEHKMLDVLKFKKGIASGILDGGDSNIFTTDDRFNEFMKTIESVTTDIETESAIESDAEREVERQMAVTPEGEVVEIEITDDEEAAIDTNASATGGMDDVKSEASDPPATIADDILAQGAGFIGGLINILGSPQQTESLISRITETDKITGQTYLKLPVSGTGTVENALKLIGKLLGGISKK